jgi:hexosaminidase
VLFIVITDWIQGKGVIMKIRRVNVLVRIVLGCLLFVLSSCTAGLKPSEPLVSEVIALIPQPQHLILKEGYFTVGPKTEIYCSHNELTQTAQLLATYVQGAVKNITGDFDRHADVLLQLNETEDTGLGREGYALSITRHQVRITANTPAGIFYGVQTLRQLLPASMETSDLNATYALPRVEIRDVPRYGWRGFMLDESRHFFGKAQVKKTLDIMAFYKLNRFHWHLTDAPGWRLEIKAYPKLTTLGSKGDWSSPENKGGFYTQSDIKEIVEYASQRHIVVVPEIDMPGHATAANRAYPQYSGGGTDRYPEFTFNPGKEGTYDYLTDILKETIDLFPSPWIHFGGDEVSFAIEKWKENADVQALMQRESLTTLYEVETYFNRRMANVIHDLGRTTVGWDEVVDAGLKPDKTVVMWWRHNKPGQLTKAIEQGFDIVLCPRIPCYFDFIQHDTHSYGRTWKGFCDLKGVYDYPEEPEAYRPVNQAHILGIQGNLWTERVHTTKRFDYMTYPRLSALAEAAWTKAENKSYDAYTGRLKHHLRRYDVWGIGYFNPFAPTSTPEPVWPEQKKIH